VRRISISLPVGLSLASCMVGLVAIVPAVVAKPPLPEGNGKALVERICVSCHEQDVVTKPRLTKPEWTRVVYDMVALGAVGTEKELDIVIEYLAKHFGKNSPEKKSTSRGAS
jgi:hypothetical protein